jgi:hypothetical protein
MIHNQKKSSKLKIYIIFLVLFFSLLNFLLTLFIQGFNASYTFLNDYFTSGDSLFIPLLPYINLLGFLPIDNQITQFSLGKLIDIIIIINLVCYAQSGIYHLVTKLSRSDETDVIDDLEKPEYLIMDNIRFGSINPPKITAIQDEFLTDSIINNENPKNSSYIILKQLYFVRLKTRIITTLIKRKLKLKRNKNIEPPYFCYSHPLFLYSFYIVSIVFSSFKIEVLIQSLNKKSDKITECNKLNLIEIKCKRFE